MHTASELSLTEIDSQSERIRTGKALLEVVSYPWGVELYVVSRLEHPEEHGKGGT